MHVLLNNKHICNTNKKLKQLPSKYRKIFLYLLSSKNKNKKNLNKIKLNKFKVFVVKIKIKF